MIDFRLIRYLESIHKSLFTESKENDEDEDERWLSRKSSRKVIKSKGTLIVCPASLIGHWEQEAKTRLKTGALKVLVYHGANREKHTEKA